MNRADILDQLSSGQITAEEAAALLRGGQPSATNGTPPRFQATTNFGNRRMRVRVSSLETGRDRVNVNVPLTLVEAGLKLGARYEPQIAGIDIAEVLGQIEAGTQGKLMDVENWEDGERVEIFIE
jgi:hypothetical protein